MQVGNGLPRIFSVVYHYSVALLQFFGFGDFRRSHQQFSQYLLVLFLGPGQPGESVFVLRNDEYVDRGDGRDISEGEDMLVLIDHVGGYLFVYELIENGLFSHARYVYRPFPRDNPKMLDCLVAVAQLGWDVQMLAVLSTALAIFGQVGAEPKIWKSGVVLTQAGPISATDVPQNIFNFSPLLFYIVIKEIIKSSWTFQAALSSRHRFGLALCTQGGRPDWTQIFGTLKLANRDNLAYSNIALKYNTWITAQKR